MSEMVGRIFTRSLEAMNPGKLVEENLRLYDNVIKIVENRISLHGIGDIRLIATGKASLEMAEAVESVLGDRLKDGIVVTPLDKAYQTHRVSILRASHPVPDDKSVKAGERVVQFLKEGSGQNLVINCISGGTSSLLTLPGGEISIEDLNKTYELLNNSGLTIRDMNTVRKHLSRIKGGQLLRHADPSDLFVDLIISDVPDDDPSIIGSGPTTPDVSTFQDAYHILLERELWEKLPVTVRTHIEKGIDGVVSETLKPGENPVDEHYSYVIGSAAKLAEKVAGFFRREGYHTWITGDAYNEDVQKVAEEIGAKAVAVAERNKPVSPPAALVFYGESTVRVKGEGKGGRNQELAIWGAEKIAGYDSVTWLSAGTDGVDGPTDAAGAVVDGETLAKAEGLGLDYREFLDRNDSYHFHEKAGTLLTTGPTGNNLMDLQIVVIE